MLFTSPKNKVIPNVDNTLTERMDKIEKDIRKLNTEMLDVITALDSIRNKVLRKIQIKEQPETPEVTILPGGYYNFK